MGTCRYSLVAVHAAGAYDTDRGLVLLHHTCLYGTCVGTQKHVWLAHYEKRVLHVACRMVRGEIQSREYVPVILYFRTFGHGETHACENVYHFVTHKAERVARTQGQRCRGACQVYVTLVVVRAA